MCYCMIRGTVFFGNNNFFKIDLNERTFVGDLSKCFTSIIKKKPFNLLYIIMNGLILGSTEQVSFDKRLSELPIAEGRCNFYMILAPPVPLVTSAIDRVHQSQNIMWSRNKKKEIIPVVSVENTLSSFINNIVANGRDVPHDGYENLVGLQDIRVVIPAHHINQYTDRDVVCDDDTICFCGDPVVSDVPISGIIRCKHMFHTSCIESWLTGNSVMCPTCQLDVREIRT